MMEAELLEKDMTEFSGKQDVFFDLLKRTYEKGMEDNDLTVEKLLDDLKLDLRKVTGK